MLAEPRNAINGEITRAVVLLAAVEPSPVGARAAIIPVFQISSLSLLAGCKQQLMDQRFHPKRLFSKILGGKITLVLSGIPAVRNVKVCCIFIRDGSITALESSFFPLYS